MRPPIIELVGQRYPFAPPIIPVRIFENIETTSETKTRNLTTTIYHNENNYFNYLHPSSSGSLPTRQVQKFDVAIPLVVELVLSAFYILPSSSSPASFVLVFHLIFFLAFSLRLPFLTVILLLECVRSTSFVWFLLCV